MMKTWKNNRDTCHCLQVLDSGDDDMVVGAAMVRIAGSSTLNAPKSPRIEHD